MQMMHFGFSLQFTNMYLRQEILHSWMRKSHGQISRKKASVYEHLKRAIDFSMNHLGPHGLPAGLHADWNDCLRLGKNGESSFVAMQLYYAFTIMRKFAEKKNDTEYIAYLDKTQKEIGEKINKLWWEDDRFNRGFKETGELIGSKKDPEASMWLNPQTWSVISGLATKRAG